MRCCGCTPGPDEAFFHGEPEEFIQWRDVDGNVINASDGGIIYADGAYHWYGQALRPLPSGAGGEGGQSTTTGVVMYGTDLRREPVKRGLLSAIR